MSRKALGPVAYPRPEVERIRELTGCRPTQTTSLSGGTGGRMQVTARVAAKGCNFLVIDRPAMRKRRGCQYGGAQWRGGIGRHHPVNWASPARRGIESNQLVGADDRCLRRRPGGGETVSG